MAQRSSTPRRGNPEVSGYPGMPGQIRVGPFIYRVSTEDGAAETAKRRERITEDDVLLGHFDYMTGIIWLRKGLPGQAAAETLLHEVMHALGQLSGVSNSKLTEEEFIGHMTPNLTGVLADNPKLVSYIADAVATTRQSFED